MVRYLRFLLVASVLISFSTDAFADQEASNAANVSAGYYGRCYAKSVPKHIDDPQSGPRQEGYTEIYRVTKTDDVLLHRYNWYSWRTFVVCNTDLVVRLGPWHRGRNPQKDHLAIAFYKGGKLLKSYSTLDISTDEKAPKGSPSTHKNVSVSTSHYNVFVIAPSLEKVARLKDDVYTESWHVLAMTLDGRSFVFDPETGEIKQ